MARTKPSKTPPKEMNNSVPDCPKPGSSANLVCKIFLFGELGSYFLRDTTEPGQLKAPGPQLTIKQGPQGERIPLQGELVAARGTDPPVRGMDGLFNCRQCL